jgi:hypothetical protein
MSGARSKHGRKDTCCAVVETAEGKTEAFENLGADAWTINEFCRNRMGDCKTAEIGSKNG